jgi:hypothetical protein
MLRRTALPRCLTRREGPFVGTEQRKFAHSVMKAQAQ